MLRLRQILRYFTQGTSKKQISEITGVAKSTLAEDIQASKTLNGNFLEALMDILAGLEEMHSTGLYHRDLKPSNVPRFEGGGARNGDYYAIGDFGLMSIAVTNITTITQTGMAKGSDFYTAPEITQDLKFASPQSDIYSVGLLDFRRHTHTCL